MKSSSTISATATTTESQTETISSEEVTRLRSALDRWSLWRPLVPPELGSVSVIEAARSEQVVRITLQATRGGRTFKYVTTASRGGADTAVRRAGRGEVALTESFSGKQAEGVVQSCLEALAQVAPVDILLEKIVPFFQREDILAEDGSTVLETSVQAERVPVFRVRLGFECKHEMRGLYQYEVCVVGEDRALCVPRPPRLWSAKTSGYVAAIAALSCFVGYGLSFLL